MILKCFHPSFKNGDTQNKLSSLFSKKVILNADVYSLQKYLSSERTDINRGKQTNVVKIVCKIEMTATKNQHSVEANLTSAKRFFKTFTKEKL